MRWGLFEIQWETTDGFLGEWCEPIYNLKKISIYFKENQMKMERMEAGRPEATWAVLAKDVGTLEWE